MRIAIIKGGLVVNIIEAENVAAAQDIFPDAEMLDGSGLSTGWVRDEAGDFAAPPAPPVVYKSISAVEFIALCRAVGGMTMAMVAQSRNNTNEDLQGMWAIFGLPGAMLHPDSPDVQGGLALLAGLGYLPNGAQAVLEEWPTV
jgi:hypothetical protein